MKLSVTLPFSLHLSVAVPLAWALPLWIDEAYTFSTTSQGPVHAFERALSFEQQAPLYFVLLSIWRLISEAPFFARLFSVVCTALTVLVVARIARHLFPKVDPGWAAAVVALSPMLLTMASEARGYAFSILMGALLVLFFVEGFVNEPCRRGRLGFVLVGVLSLYTHYYLGFVMVGLGLGLLAARGPRAVLPVLGAGAVIGVCAAPIGLWLGEQTGVGGQPEPLGWLRALHLYFGFTLDALLPGARAAELLESPTLSRVAIWGSRGVVGLLGLLALGRAFRSWALAPETRFLWLTLGIIALQMVAVGALHDGHLVAEPRYAFVLTVPAALAIHAVFAHTGRRGFLAAWVVLLMLGSAGEIVRRFEALTKPGDYARVTRYLKDAVRAGETLAVFTPEDAYVLKRYYLPDHTIVPIPRPLDLEDYDLRDLAVRRGDDVATALEGHFRRRMWLVLHRRRPVAGVDFGWQKVVQFLEVPYEIGARRQFHGDMEVVELRARD